MSISQGKLELAVLWALVTLDFEEFASASSISSALGNVAKEARVRAAIKFLISQGLVEDCSAPQQDHFEATRKGIQLIERLKEWRNPKGFVKNLDASGISLLCTQDAVGEQIDVIWKINPTEAADTKESAARDRNHEAPVNVTVAPTFNNSNNFSPQNTVTVSSSEKGEARDSSGWWNLVAAIIIGAVTIAVTLWIAGKI